MNERERNQLKLIADHALSLFRDTLQERLATIFGDHSAKGRLHSGATIRVSVRAMRELADSFLDDLKEGILAVEANGEAFDVLSEAVTDALDFCRTHMIAVKKMGAGRLSGPIEPSIARVADELFEAMQANTKSRLEIARYDFQVQTPPPQPHPEQSQPSSAPAPMRKGGRPPASYWDDMWASIAFGLYDGQLSPRSQADIEQAMLSWIEGNGCTAAISTVRARARRLWDLIQSAD